MNDFRITVRLTPELRRRIREKARVSGKRDSDVIRSAIEQSFAVEDESVTAYEILKRSGLIGAVRSAETDLSTNPKHFDDFGKF